jgi:thioredoxin-like negative regulator of GroEL
MTTVLHFWSPTCNPCKVIKPASEDMKEEFSQAEWHSINTHADTKGLARQFNVSVVPTMVVLKNGVEVGRHSGASIGIYYTIIRKALAA